MLSTDGSPGRLGPAVDVPPNDLRQDGVRFCRDALARTSRWWVDLGYRFDLDFVNRSRPAVVPAGTAVNAASAL